MVSMVQPLHLVGESVAIDAAGIQAFLVGELLEGRRVVPAGGARLLAARTLEEHPEGIGAGTERGGDAGSQAIAGGGTDDQDLLRSVDDEALAST